MNIHARTRDAETYSQRLSPGRRRRERLGLFVLLLLTLASRALFVYRGGMPDPDAVAMAAGMALGMSGDVSVGDAVLYGRHVSPGMHVLASHVFPAILGSARDVVPFLNWMTALCASLLVLPLYSLFRRHLAHASTLACIAVWVLTPVVWEAGTYYHPLVPAALLFTLALVCARQIAATPTGILFFAFASLLATAAFILRVELVIVWPALLFWMLTSKERARNTALLIVISALAATAYLSVSASVSAETTGGGVRAYSKAISSMYVRTFNLRGLPRTVTWMVLGGGLATVACCVAGLSRYSWTGERSRLRLVGLALAWSLPAILFWLPQPVPILRHYLLPSMGLVLLLGVTVLDRLPVHRLVVVSAAIASLNLLVPDVCYRAYNARTSPTKTPHGSFFYFHQRSVDRIARNVKLADRVVSCSTAGRPGRDGPRSCSLVMWEEFAHIAYAAATGTQPVEPMPVETIFPGVRYVRFAVGDGEIGLIHYVYFEDQTLRMTAARIMGQLRDNGYCLFAPRGLRERVPELMSLGDALQEY